MVAFWFILVSIVEYTAIISLMLAVFRYSVKYFWPQTLFTATLCSALSYAMSVDHDIAAAPMIQLAAMIICVWLLFNTPLLWSVIMCVSTLIVFIVFQGGIIYLSFHLGFTSPVLPKAGTEIYLIQLFGAAVELLIAYYLAKHRIGFLFVPTSREQPYVWNRIGILLFIGSILAFIALGIIYIIYLQTHFKWFPILLGIYVIISFVLLYFMRKRNNEYVNKPWTR